MKGVLMGILLGILALYIAGGVALYLSQEAFIFPRRVNQISPPDAGNPPNMEYLSLKIKEGVTLNGLGFNTRTPSQTLVLAFGGNAHDVTGMVHFLHNDVFPEETVAVAGFSYRGYPNALGRPSTGKPTEKALKADALAIYDELTTRLTPQKVHVIGYSIGSAPATYLAAHRKVESLTLAAPLASIEMIAQRRYFLYPVSFLLKYPLRVHEDISDVAAPITMIYSSTDTLTRSRHMERLREEAPASTTVVALEPPVGHGDVLNHPDIPRLFRTSTGN